MLDNPAALDAEQVVVRRRVLGPCFDNGKNEIALGDIATRNEHGCGIGLCDFGHPRFEPCYPVANFGRMLEIAAVVDKFVDPIKAQFDRHDLFEVPDEGAIRFRRVVINDIGWAIDLAAAG